MNLLALTCFLDGMLGADKFSRDPSNNGLQVDAGRREVARVVLGVDACLELFERAAAAAADLVITHHGLSWKDGFKRLEGVAAGRVGKLFTHGISLYASHLPLDAHPEIGNNAVIAKAAGIVEPKAFFEYADALVGVSGEIGAPVVPAELGEKLEAFFGASPRIFGDTGRLARKIGVVSGSAGSEGVAAAAKSGLDCLVTGEVGHESYHLIKESGISVLAFGHYHSEKCGLLALAEMLRGKFELECEFIEIPTGM